MGYNNSCTTSSTQNSESTNTYEQTEKVRLYFIKHGKLSNFIKHEVHLITIVIKHINSGNKSSNKESKFDKFDSITSDELKPQKTNKNKLKTISI